MVVDLKHHGFDLMTYSYLTYILFYFIRRQHEAEMKLVDEETANRVEEAIKKRVQERLDSDDIKLEIQKRLEEGRKKVLIDVAAQLEKEKEAAVIEARRKEASVFVFILF